MEVAASILLPGLHGNNPESALPVLLPRAYVDTLYGLKLSASASEVKVIAAELFLPPPQLPKQPRSADFECLLQASESEREAEKERDTTQLRTSESPAKQHKSYFRSHIFSLFVFSLSRRPFQQL